MKNLPSSIFSMKIISATVLTLALTACGNEQSNDISEIGHVKSDQLLTKQAESVEASDVVSSTENKIIDVDSKTEIKEVQDKLELGNELVTKVAMEKEAVEKAMQEKATLQKNDVEMAKEKIIEKSVTKPVAQAKAVKTEVANLGDQSLVSKAVEVPAQNVNTKTADTALLSNQVAEVSKPVVAPVSKVAPAFQPRSGEWTKKSQKIQGQWQIVKRVDGVYLVLGDDFKTRKAPDLKFVLSNQSVAELNNKNAMQNAVLVSQLKSVKGAQEYKLPENFNDYQTLLLHCEKYTKLWGAASIQ